MAYLIDGIVLLLFLLLVGLGVKRGFIRTITGVLTFVLALVLSSWLAGPAASLAYDAFVEPAVLSSFGEEAQSGKLSADQVDDALAEMPSFVKNQLERENLSTGEAVLEQAGDGKATLAQSISDKVVAPKVKPVLEAICSLILFLLLFLVLGWLLRVLGILAKIPGIKKVNKWLGVVAGVAQGLMWVFMAVLLINVLAASGWIDGLTPQVVKDTILVDWLGSISPVGSTLLVLLAGN